MKAAFTPRSQNNFPPCNDSKLNMKKKFRKEASGGFSLSEVLITVSIVGILSSIAAPSFHKQYASSCQSQPENTINALMTTAQAYNDEYGTPATNWKDLDSVGTLMTTDGPATSSDFSAIKLPTCDYWLEISHSGNDYVFSAARRGLEPTGEIKTDNLNVYGCLNVATGASDIALGDENQPASAANLSCE